MTYYGPFRQTLSRAVQPKYTIVRDRYRQKPPYVNRLPYLFSHETCNTIKDPWGLNHNPGLLGLTTTALSFPSTYQKAYGKYIEKAKETVNVVVNIAERKQSIDMMAKRAGNLLNFARHLRAFRFVEAGKALGLTPTAQRRSRRTTVLSYPQGEVRLKRNAKHFGDNYLEYHFGWEPLVKDIGGVIEMLHDTPFKGLAQRVSVSATETGTEPPNPTYPTIPKWSVGSKAWWKSSTVRLQASIKVDDPNLLRLNQLGFVNPAVVLWEMVPFSFIVDWFANVGQVLSSYTDLCGLSVSNASTTVFAKYERRDFWVGGVKSYGTAPFIAMPVGTASGVYMRRTLGVSAPKLTLKPIVWPSVTRGLTAVSLLTQFLRAK